MVVEMRGNGAVCTGMSLRATRPFLPLFGDLLGFSATERRRLASCLTFGVVELIAEGLVLGH
jgi:hypothetical protein